MAWKYNDRIIKEGTAWSDKDGTQHPANWSVWSDAEKKDRGLTFVEDEDTNFDNRFYLSKGVERSLDDVLVTDENGDKVISEITGKQMVHTGLKSRYVSRTKLYAQEKLSVSDWYIIRATDDASLAVPSDITSKRKAIRDASKTIEDKINACTKLSEFMALFDVPVDKDGKITGNAPIDDWPTE